MSNWVIKDAYEILYLTLSVIQILIHNHTVYHQNPWLSDWEPINPRTAKHSLLFFEGELEPVPKTWACPQDLSLSPRLVPVPKTVDWTMRHLSSLILCHKDNDCWLVKCYLDRGTKWCVLAINCILKRMHQPVKLILDYFNCLDSD